MHTHTPNPPADTTPLPQLHNWVVQPRLFGSPLFHRSRLPPSYAAEAALEQSMLNSGARPRRSSTSTTSLTAPETLRPRIPVAAPHTQMNATGSSRTRISPAPTSVLESQQYRDMEARALAAESRLATPRGTAAARERELDTLRSRNQTLEREIEDLHSRTKRLRGR